MYSKTLECSHEFHFRSEGGEPTDLVFCYRCDDYRYPQGYVAPKRRGRAIKDHVDKSRPQKPREPNKSPVSGLPLKHYDPLPRSGKGGKSLSAENKALALKRTYEMADEGYTVYEIAEAQGFNPTTIRVWLSSRA